MLSNRWIIFPFVVSAESQADNVKHVRHRLKERIVEETGLDAMDAENEADLVLAISTLKGHAGMIPIENILEDAVQQLEGRTAGVDALVVWPLIGRYSIVEDYVTPSGSIEIMDDQRLLEVLLHDYLPGHLSTQFDSPENADEVFAAAREMFQEKIEKVGWKEPQPVAAMRVEISTILEGHLEAAKHCMGIGARNVGDGGPPLQSESLRSFAASAYFQLRGMWIRRAVRRGHQDALLLAGIMSLARMPIFLADVDDLVTDRELQPLVLVRDLLLAERLESSTVLGLPTAGPGETRIEKSTPVSPAIEALQGVVWSNTNPIRDAFQIAINRFLKGRWATDHSDAVIDYWVAIEALLGSKGDTVESLQRRIPSLFSESIHRPFWSASEIADLYALRCDVVHGNRGKLRDPSRLESSRNETDELAERVILRAAEVVDAKKLATPKQLKEYLDARAIS